MNWIVIGGTAFILLTLFDLNKLYKWHWIFNAFFALGILLLTFSLIMILKEQIHYGYFEGNYLFCSLIIIGAILQIYALFFALPAKDTYTLLDEIQLVDTGLYGLCRHPGVYGFLLMGIGFSLGTGSILITFTAIIWSLLDLVHVWIQDQFIFPLFIPGYKDYQKRVGFLFIKTKENVCQNLS